MPEKIFNYDSDNIKISYNSKLCIHAAECSKGLPEVFNPKMKPWVNPSAADVQNIVDVIVRCPSGALKYERLDEDSDEQPSGESKIVTVPNGPIYIRGNITLSTNSGNVNRRETRIALCRCGQSKNKPYCDNTHLEVNFNAE
jgi:uncharacterized Fe-S cluster protein YjdI